MDLPDAPGDPPPGPGSCPICGMALEPVTVTADVRPEPGAGGHDPPVLGRRSRWRSRCCSWRWAATWSRGPRRVSPRGVGVDPAGAGHAGGAVGGLALLRARLDLGADPEPEHVHADRDGHRGRLAVQRGRHARPGHLPGRVPRWTARSTSTSRPAAVITVWCCSGRSWSCAPGSRPPGRSGPCWTSPRRPRTGSPRTAPRRRSPLEQVQLGDRLRVRPGEAGPGRRHRRGRPLLGGRVAGHRRVDAGHQDRRRHRHRRHRNRTGSLVMRADKVGRDTMLARIVQMVAEAQRSRAPIQRLADRVAAWFVPAVIVAAVVAFVVWALVGPDPRLAHALDRRGHRADHRLPVCPRAGHARCRSWSASAAAPGSAC